MRKVVLDLLAEPRTSFWLFQRLTDDGFWFVQARLYPLLRQLTREGVLMRGESPGTPERHGRPVFMYRLADR